MEAVQAPNNQYFDPYSQVKCPICGSTDFEWGRLSAQTVYYPDSSMWKVRGRQLVKVRRCRQCNNLMTFADPDRTRQLNTMALVIVIVVFVILLAVFLPALLGVHR